jgi:Flp pilus assembly secretin CpaC
MKRLIERKIISFGYKSLFLVVSFLILAPLSGAPKAEAKKPNEVEKAVVEAETQRQTIADDVKKLCAEAKDLLSENKFADSLSKCMLAKDKLAPYSGDYFDGLKDNLDSLITTINLKWGDWLFAEARAAFEKGEYKQAIYLAKKSAKMSPKLTANTDSFIKECTKFIDAETYKEETDLLTIDPENPIRKRDIAVLYRQSKILYKNELYSQARDALEKILIKDPYNQDAISMLDKIYERLYNVASQRRKNEELERIAEINWKWNEGVLPTEAIRPKDSGPNVKTSSKAGLYDKLQKIILDQVEFDDANISSVIQLFRNRSRQLDPDQVGINIILKLSPEATDTLPPITMSFDRIPIGEAIRYLCQGTGLKYRVEERAVIIGDKDIDEMDRRFFPVRAELIRSIIPSASADGEKDAGMMEADGDVVDLEQSLRGGEEGGEGGGAAKAADAGVLSEALKTYFIDRGIPFEEGSTIAYDRRAGKLIVKNTPENLRKFEQLLREIDITTPLVLIEAKILEITQTDIEELGFDWVFNADATAKSDWSVANTEKILRSYSATNFNSTGTADRPAEIIKNMDILPNFGSGGDMHLSVTVNALDQNQKGEVLSAPKVIATSGTTAIIRMVREEYYPESWTEPEVSSGSSGSYDYTPSYPEFGDPTDVGIRFEVTPTVSPNNYTISLHLNPQVVALSGWSTYNVQFVIGGITTTNNAAGDSSFQIKMPELSRRDLDTNIKVYDGETVVLGGMLKDTIDERNDKWPGIGEIPVLGRLFSSKANRSVKTNLLIFVTSRLMNNDGVPVRPDSLRGVPEYNR